MKINVKQAVIVFASIIFVSGIGQTIPVAVAATVAELQAQINALTAQLQQQQNGTQNQAGISGMSSSITTVAAPTSDCDVNRMTRIIRLGSRGKDVLCLQEFLIEEEFLRVSATGYFGSATNSAFKKWQASRGISVTGVFGSESRAAYIAAVNGGSGDSGTTPTPPQMCTQVAKQCSDGSYVGYKAGTCEFKECPVSIAPLPPPSKEVLSISGIYPTSGPVGTVVYMNGSKFTQDTYIMIDGMYGQIITPQKSTICTQSIPGTCYTSLYFTTPSTLSVGTHTLQVSDKGGDGTVSNAVKLTVTGEQAIPLPCGETSASGVISNPCQTQKLLTLTSVMPALALPGSTVTVYGSGFNYATFAMIDGSYNPIQPNAITLLSNAQLSFTLPTNLKYGNHSLQVGEKAGSALSNTINFTVGDSQVPTCTLTTDKSSYMLGDTIKFSWTSQNATYATFKQDTSGKDYLAVAGDKLYANGSQIATANVVGNPVVTLMIYGYGGSNSCTVTVPVISSISFTVSPPSVVRGGGLLKLPAIAGANEQRIAAFTVNAGSALSLSSITLGKFVTNLNLQNLKVFINGAQFGTTRATVGASEPSMVISSTYPVILGQYSATNIDVYADVLSTTTANTYYDAIEFIGWAATYSYNNASINFPFTVVGQDLDVSSPISATPSITVSMNSAFNNPTYSTGMNQKIASFVASASANQSIGIGSLTLAKYSNTNLALQNIRVMVNGAQFGQMQTVVSSNQIFSGSTPISVPASGSVVIDVYADVLTSSSSGTYESVITLIGWSAYGNISASAIPFPGNVNGQIITIIGTTNGGGGGTSVVISPTVAMNSAFNNPIYHAGDTNKKVASFEFRAPANNDMSYGTFGFKNNSSALGLQNLKIMIGSTQIGQTQAVVTKGELMNFQSYYAVIVPAGSAIYIDVYADILSSVSPDVYSGVVSMNFVSANYKNPWGTYSLPAPVSGQMISIQ